MEKDNSKHCSVFIHPCPQMKLEDTIQDSASSSTSRRRRRRRTIMAAKKTLIPPSLLGLEGEATILEDDATTVMVEKKMTVDDLLRNQNDISAEAGAAGMPKTKRLRRTESISDCAFTGPLPKMLRGMGGSVSDCDFMGQLPRTEVNSQVPKAGEGDNHKVETKVAEVPSSGVMVYTEDNLAGLSLLQDLVQLRLD